MSFYKLLNNIQQRPEMYLPNTTINHLRSFIVGYTVARKEQGLLPDADQLDFVGFPCWLQDHYHVNLGRFPHWVPHWANLINFYASNESTSLDLFFDLLGKFQARKPH